MTVKTTEDIITDLLNLINPVMIMITHYHLLAMFVEDYQYDGLLIDETLDYINDYYETYSNTDSPKIKEKIRKQCQKDNINPMYLSEFYITYSNELQTITGQTPEENREYLTALKEEMLDPTEMINDVQEYIKNLPNLH